VPVGHLGPDVHADVDGSAHQAERCVTFHTDPPVTPFEM
jgi:hypothetical protein